MSGVIFSFFSSFRTFPRLDCCWFLPLLPSTAMNLRNWEYTFSHLTSLTTSPTSLFSPPFPYLCVLGPPSRSFFFFCYSCAKSPCNYSFSSMFFRTYVIMSLSHLRVYCAGLLVLLSSHAWLDDSVFFVRGFNQRLSAPQLRQLPILSPPRAFFGCVFFFFCFSYQLLGPLDFPAPLAFVATKSLPIHCRIRCDFSRLPPLFFLLCATHRPFSRTLGSSRRGTRPLVFMSYRGIFPAPCLTNLGLLSFVSRTAMLFNFFTPLTCRNHCRQPFPVHPRPSFVLVLLVRSLTPPLHQLGLSADVAPLLLRAIVAFQERHITLALCKSFPSRLRVTEPTSFLDPPSHGQTARRQVFSFPQGRPNHSLLPVRNLYFMPLHDPAPEGITLIFSGPTAASFLTATQSNAYFLHSRAPCLLCISSISLPR